MNIQDALTIHQSSSVLFEQQEIDVGIAQMAAFMAKDIDTSFPLVYVL